MKIKSTTSTILLLVFGYFLMGIDGCGSKEMTSAKMYFNQKEYEKALAAVDLEIAAQEAGTREANAEAYYYKGNICYELKKYQEMADTYRRGKEIGFKPDQAAAAESRLINAWGNTLNAGIKLLQENDYAGAETSFKESTMILPDSAMTYYNLAIAQYNQKKYAEVIETLNTYFEKTPVNQEALGVMLSCYFNLQQYDEAIAVLNKYKGSETIEQEWLYENIAQTYISAGKTDQALDAFKEAASASPENEVLQYNVGVLYLNGDDYDTAVPYFERALEINPDYMEARYNLGVTFLRKGKKAQEAWEESYNKAKTRSEKNKIAQNKDYMQFYEKALPHLEAVKDSREDDSSFWSVLAQIYTVLGMKEKAEAAFSRIQ